MPVYWGVLYTLSLTQQGFETMTSGSWQNIPCAWGARFNHCHHQGPQFCHAYISKFCFGIFLPPACLQLNCQQIFSPINAVLMDMKLRCEYAVGFTWIWFWIWVLKTTFTNWHPLSVFSVCWPFAFIVSLMSVSYVCVSACMCVCC